MKSISIDLETFSSVDLSKCGVYKYVESPDFEILLFGYSVDGSDIRIVDLACGEIIPDEILKALTDNSVTKWAFNCQFERICISQYLSDLGFSFSSRYLNPSSWKCSMVWASTLGLPRSLENVGTVLGLDKQKLSEGKDLIKYFCAPCSPTKSNGGRTRNLPSDAPDKWECFKKYNRRDVEVEERIRQRLSNYPASEEIWDEYMIDQEINDRGITVDMYLVRQAIAMDKHSRAELIDEMTKLTKLQNPNSVQQIKQWFTDNGFTVDSLGKKDVAKMLETATSDFERVLLIRQRLAKSSVKKYTSMSNAVCNDGRVRGMFQFYGANRTGRFSSKIIQLQNLPQNHLYDLKQARALVRSGNYEAVKMLYSDVPDTLSQLIRTALIPKKGKQFIVSDFSAIEARVIAWLAGEQWRIQIFSQGGDIYCASASQMFKVPVEKHGVNGHLRQKGKIAELALGYGGSVGALRAMGAGEMGLDENELQPLVKAWRNANPNIVKLWWDVDRCVKDAVAHRTKKVLRNLVFECKSGMLFITLPSGRKLAYVKPHIGENRFGGKSVTYEGVSGNKKWERIESYGPKFVENIVQAIARDILCFAIKTLHDFSIVAHVHDEIIIEADKETPVSEVCALMSRTPDWARGLILNADGYTCEFYKKD